MRKMLGLAAAAFLALGVSAGSAEEVKGAIMNIDAAKGTFQVGEKIFQASEANTEGPDLSELKEGEQVKVMFEEDPGTTDMLNALVIEKAE